MCIIEIGIDFNLFQYEVVCMIYISILVIDYFFSNNY